MVDIRLYCYNIRKGLYRGIKLMLCVIVQANMDLGVMFNTNIMNSVNLIPLYNPLRML